MQREKATCLPQLIAQNLPRKLALVHPQTARRLHNHTRRINNTNKKQYKNSKTILEKLEKMQSMMQGSRERKNR